MKTLKEKKSQNLYSEKISLFHVFHKSHWFELWIVDMKKIPSPSIN